MISKLFVFAVTTVLVTFSQVAMATPVPLHYFECHSDRGLIAKGLLLRATATPDGAISGELVANMMRPIELDCSSRARHEMRRIIDEQQVMTSANLCKTNSLVGLTRLAIVGSPQVNFLCRSAVMARIETRSVSDLMEQVGQLDKSSDRAPLFANPEQYVKFQEKLVWMKPNQKETKK